MKTKLDIFIKKSLLLFLPFLAVVLIYFIADPFKVLRVYNDYNASVLESNPGYVEWQNYLNHKDTMHYNSFVLGNSCTMAYPNEIWNKYIPNSRAICLHGSAESLYAITKKIERIDALGDSINNVLIPLDYSTLRKYEQYKEHTFILHPDITENDKLTFQITFLKAFFKPVVLGAFIDYKLFGKPRKYMRGIVNTVNVHKSSITNNFVNPREKEIAEKGEKYWQENAEKFFLVEKETLLSPIIGNKQIILLNRIANVLKKHKSNYRIIVNPNWKQEKLNPMDVAKLKEIFGNQFVFDFSGRNKFSTNSHYYYENAHYRPKLGNEILKIIYRHNGTQDNTLTN